MPIISFFPEGHAVEINSNSPLTELGDMQQEILFFGCRAGACGTCAIKVHQGMESLTEKNSKEEKLLEMMAVNAPDHRLACQCRVMGDVTIQPLDD